MRTTIVIPDETYHSIKVLAAERGTTVRNLEPIINFVGSLAKSMICDELRDRLFDTQVLQNQRLAERLITRSSVGRHGTRVPPASTGKQAVCAADHSLQTARDTASDERADR